MTENCRDDLLIGLRQIEADEAMSRPVAQDELVEDGSLVAWVAGALTVGAATYFVALA